MLTYHWWVLWHSHDVSFPSERQCVNWVSKCIFVISSPFSRNHTVDGMRLSMQQQNWPTMHRFITPLLCRVVNPTWWSHFCVFLRNVISIASDNTQAEVSHTKIHVNADMKQLGKKRDTILSPNLGDRWQNSNAHAVLWIHQLPLENTKHYITTRPVFLFDYIPSLSAGAAGQSLNHVPQGIPMI